MDDIEKRFNFGVVEPGRVYRSRQPDREFLEYLKSRRGVKTILCLKIEEDEAFVLEREFCKNNGIAFEQLPIKSWRRWPEPDEIKDFFKILDDPANYPVLFHCQAGRDRTSAIAAIYRLKYQKWTMRKALAEMNKWGANWYWRLFIIAEAYKIIEGFEEKNIVLLYLKRFLNVIFGIEGLLYAIKYEKNIKIFLAAEAVLFIITIWHGITPGKLSLLLLGIGVFNALEMINSAAERIVNLLYPKFDYRVKVIKDLLAAGPLFLGIFGFAAWLVLILF